MCDITESQRRADQQRGDGERVPAAFEDGEVQRREGDQGGHVSYKHKDHDSCIPSNTRGTITATTAAARVTTTRMSEGSKLFVYGINEKSPPEAIAEFARFGEVTNLFSPRGRKVLEILQTPE